MGKTAEQQAESLEVKTPEWVAEILKSNAEVVASNQALIESNSALTESIESFKESANEIISNIGERVEAASEQKPRLRFISTLMKITRLLRENRFVIQRISQRNTAKVTM